MTDFTDRTKLPGVFNRVSKGYERPVWPESSDTKQVFLQGADLNEAVSGAHAKIKRVGNLTAKDGDRISGADIIVDAGTVVLAAGSVYVDGDVRSVASKTLTGVSMAGEVSIGVRLIYGAVTADDDDELLGLMPGTEAEGEPGAARETVSVEWSLDDGSDGDFYQVYLLKDGVPIDQTPPPSLSGVNAAIGIYDRGAHGNYVVSGCEVTALGSFSGKQVFSIAAGEANIWGAKFTRLADLRHEEPEEPDTDEIVAEPRTYDTSAGSFTFAPYHLPVSSVAQVTLEKEVTETVTRGAVSNSADALAHGSVKTIIEVKMGGTTYVAGADYKKTGDTVDWSLAGSKPAPGNSYTVKYRYIDALALGAGYTFNASSITVNGGVNGGEITVRYSFKLPRVDILCFNATGHTVYLKGIAARQNPLVPATPTNLLKLAEIHNSWTATPTVVMNLIARAVHYDEQQRNIAFMLANRELIDMLRLNFGIDRRDPVAKLGSFTDPLASDDYRDAGVAQTGAIVPTSDGRGELRLAIDGTLLSFPFDLPQMLDYTVETILSQPLYSFCQPINPFKVVDLLPGELVLNPPTDFWTEFSEQWLSGTTAAQATGAMNTVTVGTETKKLELLRQIPVAFTIRGFLANEQLSTLTFDGVSVLPVGPLTADAHGTIVGTFAIPSGIKAGSKGVSATGSAGSFANAMFVGEGSLTITTRRNVATQTRVARDPRGPANDNGGPAGDPVYQSFSLTEGRHLVGVSLTFCKVGDRSKGVIVDLVDTTNDGHAGKTVIAQAFVDMNTVVEGQSHNCMFRFPAYVTPNTLYAFVVRTADEDHSIAAARIGEADKLSGKRVGQQPYLIGNMGISSNNTAWVALHDCDVTFDLLAARFSPVTKSVPLGSFNTTDMSDIYVPAAIDLPDEHCAMRFELVRQSGDVIRLSPGQAYQFSEYVSELVALRAVLDGTSTASPILYPVVQAVVGTIRTAGDYVSKAMSLGVATEIVSYIRAYLPAGSSLSVSCSVDGGAFAAMAALDTEVLDLGWQHMRHRKTGLAGNLVRLKLSFTGGPAARPALADITHYLR